MSISQFFNPESIAVIGASRDKQSVGYAILSNILGKSVFGDKTGTSFKGKVFPVNPNADKILGKECYKSILDVDEKIDLAIICVPARFVVDVARQCVQKEIHSAVIISAGFSEDGEEGKKRQNELADVAKRGELRIIGPNCLGIIRPDYNLNASFAPVTPKPGHIAFVSQSGALLDSILDWSIDNNFGMSAVVSVGNQMDVELSEILEYLGEDKETKCIALYLENIKNGQKFMEVASNITKKKPIIAIKAGKTKEGSKAVSSHTGNLAGAYEIYSAALRQCGVIQVETIEELLYLSDTLARYPQMNGKGVAIITNGGGCGVLCADKCHDFGLLLPDLTSSTLKSLEATGKMHPAYSHANPIDLVGDALPERYDVALDIVLKQDDISGAIVIQTMQTMTDTLGNAKAVCKVLRKYPKKPIVCVFLGSHYTRKGIEFLEVNGVKNFDDVSKAALAMSKLVK